MFTVSAKNTMLGALAPTHAALHSAYPGADGSANELSGGSPAYARKAITIGAAANGVRQASTQPTFDVPAGSTVAWASLWTAITGGTCLSVEPLGGTPKEMQADPAADLIRSAGHGFADGDAVVFFDGAPPAPLVAGTIYYVRDSATDTLKVATTAGGAAIDLTTAGDASVKVSAIVPESFAGQGTYQLQGDNWDLNG